MEPFDDVIFTEAGHLPIVKEYAKRINLVDTIDSVVESQMELKPGLAVLAMVIDTLFRTKSALSVGRLLRRPRH
jgi:hypothetical protein